jgi:hypothetical protein
VPDELPREREGVLIRLRFRLDLPLSFHLPTGCHRARLPHRNVPVDRHRFNRKGTEAMVEAVLEAGIACTYTVAAREAREIGHKRLAVCYLVIAILATGLACCRAAGI